MTTVVVTVPAHDEEDELPDCLRHVAGAVAQARAAGALSRVVVAVGAHRCRDDTLGRAHRVLAGLPDVEPLVAADPHSASVGQVRAGLVAAVCRRHAELVPQAPTTWLFHTDADSHVPPDWITGTLAQLRRRDAVAAAGMVALRAWDAPEAARRRYAGLVAAGLGTGGRDGEGHDHVYGANLVVRLDAYLAVGGFRDVVHGEDHDLVDRLHARGHRVPGLLTPVVSTSSRSPGRAEHGLGALLRGLGEEAQEEAGDVLRA